MAFMIDRCPSADSPRLGAMTLSPHAESVPQARRWFRRFISPYNPACSIDDCVLMLSELVTNAILYGRSDAEWHVWVEWFCEGTDLRVEVHNPELSTDVQVQRPDADDAHGRGLLLVESIAHSWQCGPSCFGGTVVSFVIDDAWPSDA